MRRLTEYEHHVYKTAAGERLRDFARQQFVPATEEEYVRQDVLHCLHKEYGYPRQALGSEVRIGSGRRAKGRADVMVKLPRRKPLIVEARDAGSAPEYRHDRFAFHPPYSSRLAALNNVLKGNPCIKLIEVPDYITLSVDGHEVPCQVLGFWAGDTCHWLQLRPSIAATPDLWFPPVIEIQVNGSEQVCEDLSLSRSLGIPECRSTEECSEAFQEVACDLWEEGIFPQEIDWNGDYGLSEDGKIGWLALYPLDDAEFEILAFLDTTKARRYLRGKRKLEGRESEQSEDEHEEEAGEGEDPGDADGGRRHPFIVVECKAPGLDFTEEMKTQGMRYVVSTGAQFLVVTNGDWCHSYWHGKNRDQEVEDIPSYEEAIDNKPYQVQRVPEDEPPVPLPPNIAKESFLLVIHERARGIWSTPVPPRQLWRPLLAIDDVLIGPDSLFKQPFESFGVRFVEDLGCFFHEVGNPSGRAFPGKYRDILMEGPNGQTVILGLLLHGYLGGTLVGAMSFDAEYHPVTQYAISRHMTQVGDRYEFTHDARLTVGKGAVKTSRVLDFIYQHEPALVRSGKIYLGSIPDRNPLAWQDVSEFISRFAAYTILRHEFKQDVRKSRDQAKKMGQATS